MVAVSPAEADGRHDPNGPVPRELGYSESGRLQGASVWKGSDCSPLCPSLRSSLALSFEQPGHLTGIAVLLSAHLHVCFPVEAWRPLWTCTQQVLAGDP